MASSKSAAAGLRAGLVGLGAGGALAGGAPGTVAALHSTVLPDEVRHREGFEQQMRGFMKVAEKDLARAREAGVALPGRAMALQIMARIYDRERPQRR